ncbi:hypothetical protein MMC17_007668 [Xylographa soralifera]|nr:hypothetical protein [Xylographa soralifera]
MDDSELLPDEPWERRRIQNRNAQRKYRSRRNQHRVDQAAQEQEQEQAEPPSSNQLLSSQPTAYNAWDAANPSPYGLAFPQEGTSFSSELQVPTQAAYSTAGSGPASQTTTNGANVFDFNYSAPDMELSAYLYSLPGCLPVLPHDTPTAFGTLSTARGFTHDTAASSPLMTASATKPMNPDITPNLLRGGSEPKPDWRFHTAPTLPVHSTFRQGTANDQLYTHVPQPSTTMLDLARTASPSTTSIACSSTSGSTSDTNITSISDSSGINDDDLPILHIASHRGHDKIVRILLEREVNMDERDSSGRTALQLAAIHGHTTVVELLLQRGADVNATDAVGLTALHWATLQKHEPVLRMCIDSGADVNICDANGWTALHVAVERGFEAGLKLLLRHGADLSIMARKCETWKQSEPAS